MVPIVWGGRSIELRSAICWSLALFPLREIKINMLLHWSPSVLCDQYNPRGGKMAAKRTDLRMVESIEMRPVAAKGREANEVYRVREHLTEAEMTKLPPSSATIMVIVIG